MRRRKLLTAALAMGTFAVTRTLARRGRGADAVAAAPGAAVSDLASVPPVALGAWIPGSWGSGAPIDAFTSLVGAAPALLLWYQDWVHNPGFNAASLDVAYDKGAAPVLTWEPWDYTAGPNQPAFALKNLVAGAYDAFILQWARGAASWGKSLFLRPMHEMNGNWYPWAAGVNGNAPSDYVAAWQRVVRIFRSVGATNVRWVWSPYVVGGLVSPFETFYPGDDWVDWVALDGYNWGTTQSWSQWRALIDVFGPSYATLAQLTAKPMMIAEIGSAEQGGDKAAWITQGLLSDAPTQLPRVRFILWFDENKETDWRVNSSSTSLAAFSQVAGSPAFSGRLVQALSALKT